MVQQYFGHGISIPSSKTKERVLFLMYGAIMEYGLFWAIVPKQGPKSNFCPSSFFGTGSLFMGWREITEIAVTLANRLIFASFLYFLTPKESKTIDGQIVRPPTTKKMSKMPQKQEKNYLKNFFFEKNGQNPKFLGPPLCLWNVKICRPPSEVVKNLSTLRYINFWVLGSSRIP